MEFLYEQLGLLGPAMGILILVLITGIIFLWKAIVEKDKKSENERIRIEEKFERLVKDHSDKIENLMSSHAEEKKDLYEYVQDSLNKVASSLEAVKDYIKDLQK